jgi:UDP-N-acetyl-D-galactosamine dehydrogenase
LPVAVAFGKQGLVIGYDKDERRVAELRQGLDCRKEVDPAALREAKGLTLTHEASELQKADFHIVAVPTPIDAARQPDLSPLLEASRTVGGQLRRGAVVVFESTVYPGVTEDECVPVLEAASGLRCGADFTVGYSPERINPGDTEHTFDRIMKIVSGQDAATLELVARVYGSVLKAGVHRAPSIKVAEAAKVVENTQRDLNIALMNELVVIFHKLGIDTADVLEAAGTKWNFLHFKPGLVGGHCIGVDPYYLTHKAERLDYHPDVILHGRKINNGMGRYVAAETIKCMLRHGHFSAGGASKRRPVVTVLGVTFKEDVKDVRNSRVQDILRELEGFGVEVQVHDAMADARDARHEYGLELKSYEQLAPAQAIILAVSHEEYRRRGWSLMSSLLEGGRGVVADVKGCLDRATRPENLVLWRL